MESQSIHPRVVNGRAQFPKVNTAKPWGGKNKDFEKRRDRLSKRRLAREATVADLSRNGSKRIDFAGAFKAPGSMKR